MFMNPIPQIPSETSFFRDFQVFEGLRRRIFPELFRRNYQQQQLNIWSAACFSGPGSLQPGYVAL